MEEEFTPRGRKKSYTERIKPSIRPILKEAISGWDSSSSAVLSPITELKREDKRIKQRSHSDPFINSWEYGQQWLTDSSESRHRTQSTPPKQNVVGASSPIETKVHSSETQNMVSPESKKDKKLKKKLKRSKESSSPMSSREDIHQHSPLRLSLIYKNILEELEGHDLRFKTTRRGAKILLAGSVDKMLRCLIEKSWEDPNTTPSSIIITSPTSISVGRSRSDSNVVRKWRRKYDEYKIKSDGDMFVIYFILTHTYFITTLNLLEELIKRFNQSTEKLKDNELTIEERTFQTDIKSRILFIIKRWLTYSIDDLLEEKLSEVLLNFMKELDKNGNKEQYDSLYRVYKISLLQKNSISANITQELDKKEQKIKAIKTFSDVPSYIIARQMSLMDFKAFSSLKSRDLVHLHWKENNIRVSDIFANFTGISLWVATEILSFPNIKQRTNILAKFITLCEELLGMNNYQGAAAIYTGLSLPPISRLDQTWKNLDLKYEKLPSIWSDIQSLFSPSNNYEQYRDRIKKSSSPLIPYHIIYLQDLEELENHYKDLTDDNLVNWRKLRKIGRIVATVKKHQQSPYIYAPNGLVQEFLSKLGVLEIDKLSELSKKYETSIEVITPVNRSLHTLRDPLRRKINKSKQQTNALRNIVNNNVNSSIQPYRRASFIVVNENNDNNTIDPIIDSVTDSKSLLIDLICSLHLQDLNNVSKVSKSIAILFELQYKSMVLMKKLVFKEIELQGIEGTKSSTIVPVHLIANYFKQDLLFSNQILQQYCILVGKSFLTKAISPVLKKLTSKQKTYEISPDKITKKEDIKLNVKNITKLVSKLLTSILCNVDECPYPIRILCTEIRETMEKQGHKDISLRASIAFLFYRFLCPAILNPELYDIYEKNISKEIKRALELASKIMKGLIFAEIPTADQYLRESILQLTPLFKRPIEEFADKLIGDTPEVAYDFEVSISAEDQKQSCLIIRNFIVDNLKYLDSISSNSKLLNPFLAQKVFGYPLYAVIRREATSLGIPTILEKSMKFLLEKVQKLELEGIFRISGESDKVQTLKTTFDNGEYVDLSNEDPYVVADVIKLYLKSLPESLIPSNLFDEVAKIATIHDTKLIHDKITHILTSLPSENLNVLKHLVNFLIEISKYSTKTMMGSHNLALMFGPNIVRQHKSDLNNNVFSTGNDFLEILMEHKDQYFA